MYFLYERIDYEMSKLVVAQSGGPTSAINATLAGVIMEAQKSDKVDKVLGSLNGIEGILNNNLVDLTPLTAEQLETLKVTPAAALGSCRYKMPDFKTKPEIYEKIINVLKANNIEYFLYIGGNDSMDTVLKLSQYCAIKGENIKVMGVPKTIDNDLPVTDHTPGFGSAAKYIATTMAELRRDCDVYTVDAVTIVEIMGRNAGWLTAAAALSGIDGRKGPQLIYLPEAVFDMQRFVKDVKEALKSSHAVLVAVSEGVKDADGKYVAESNQSGAVDNFGHKYLSGVGKVLENMVRNEIGCKVRSIELNLMQRCAGHILSKTDIDESVMIGSFAAKSAISGLTGKMGVFKRESGKDYKIGVEIGNIEDIANKEKTVPREWINKEGNNVTQEAVDYILPLIQGEVPYKTKNGLPVHLELK